MNIHEVHEADDGATFAITGADLKTLLHYAQMLSSGLSPKGEMCFLYGKTMHAIVSRAEEVK